MDYRNRMKTFAFFLKKNFKCLIEIFEDYIVVLYRGNTYCFRLKYDYMLSFEDDKFFDLNEKVNEFNIVDFFISIIPEKDFDKEVG